MRTTEREILYGRQPVREVLRASRRQVFRVIAAGENRPCREVHEILRAAESRGIRVQVVQAREVGNLAGNGHHQGIVAEVGPYPYAQWDSLPPPRDAAGPLYLLLDHVQDPQNLGSLLRSAEAAGVDAVILPAWRAAGVTPAVVRASSGASEHIRTVLLPNLVHAMDRLRQAGVRLAGLEALPESADLYAADLGGPLGVVVGGEGEGLKRIVRERCDVLVRIPMLGRIGSLNAGVAGAVALFEARRQRSAGRA